MKTPEFTLAPSSTNRCLVDALALSTGWVVADEGTRTLSAVDGAPEGDQLPALDQVLELLPFQVLVMAGHHTGSPCGGNGVAVGVGVDVGGRGVVVAGTGVAVGGAAAAA